MSGKRQANTSANGTPAKKGRLITDFFKTASKDNNRTSIVTDTTKTIEKLDPADNKENIVAKPEVVESASVTREEILATHMQPQADLTSDNSKNNASSDDSGDRSASDNSTNNASSNDQTTGEQKNDEEGADDDQDYSKFCAKHNFNKETWIQTLTAEQKELLKLEIDTLHITWLVFLHKELTKPYFLKLKTFLRSQSQSGKVVFPPARNVYSWSHYTPLPHIKCLVLGQDPYHNYNQAHGLAFSVLQPTRPPPSLVNIYKALTIDFPEFKTPTSGELTKWAKRGILMLNAALTVEAHKANSHANQGWETFTEEVIKTAIDFFNKEKQSGFVIMAWGSPAQKRVGKFEGLLKTRQGSSAKHLVIRSVHPSPLSAHRGFFDSHVFRKCNEWLESKGQQRLDWGLVDGNTVT